MGAVECPVVMWRNRTGTTQQALAKKVGLSRPQLSRIEAGMYESLPEKIVELTGITDELYQHFRARKRKAFDLTSQNPLSEFAPPDELKAWRQLVAWNKFLPPGTSAFAAAICLNVNYIAEFEKRKVGQMPPALWNALLSCGLRVASDELYEVR